MKLTPITINISDYPDTLHRILTGAQIFDSSSSPMARVLYIQRDGVCTHHARDYFLKTAARGSLKQEYELTRYFNKKGLAADSQLLTDDAHDYLLTEAVPGKDCTDAMYLSDPKRLCDTLAQILFTLHEIEHDDCNINHTDRYIKTIEQNYRAGDFDLSYCDSPEIKTADEAYKYAKEHIGLLERNTLLHGDYCLPNVILRDWKLSGFVDVGNGGVGDRHVDLFWGAWTLRYNLGTDEYRQRFFDAYGRDRVDTQRLKLIGICEVFG